MRTRLLLHIVDMFPYEGTPAEHAAVIAQELELFSPTLAQHDRWLVLNKMDLLSEEDGEQRVKDVIAALDWQGPVYTISALTGDDTKALCFDILEHVEAFREKMLDEEFFAAQHERLRQIQLEGRESISRASEKRWLGDDSEDFNDDDDFDDDDYDVEVEYVRE